MSEIPLGEWRDARARAMGRWKEFKACSPGARRLGRHMVKSRDPQDGQGMFRSPRKLAKELNISESTVRRHLKELVAKGVFTKERRRDPRGTGRRDKTSAYHLRDELLPARLRCVTVTDLRADQDGDRPNADGPPPDRPADTPRRSASHFTVKRSPSRAAHTEQDRVLGESTDADALVAYSDLDEDEAWKARFAWEATEVERQGRLDEEWVGARELAVKESLVEARHSSDSTASAVTHTKPCDRCGRKILAFDAGLCPTCVGWERGQW